MKIAIVDDQEEIRYSLSKILKREGHETIEFCGDEEDIAQTIVKAKPSLTVIDVMLGVNISGIELAGELQSLSLHSPIVLITAYTTPSNVIEASRIGVKDILQKPFEPQEFLDIVNRYAPTKRSKSQDLIFYEDDGEAFVGSFETMKNVYKKIGIAANNELSVLIRGETGSGKELIAKMIHKSSDRANKPFVAVNCAAIPSEIFESQVFGHEKGSFTGADKQYIGLVEQAGEGTLFLDEIGELEPQLQSKMLRFLETKVFRRLGSSKEISSKARIISATNIDIAANVNSGLFREDLFYRLAMILIEVPPLSKRQSDIPALCNHFISKANKELKTNIKSISKDAMALLLAHPWSGNVREFRNTIYNAALDADSEIIRPNDIKFSNLLQKNRSTLVDAISQLIEEYGVEFGARAFEKMEREFLREFLRRCPNYSQAANHLEMARNTLKVKLKNYGIYEKSDEDDKN